MKISGYFLIILALCFITGLPYKASAHKHIPFYATYPNEEGASTVYVYCQGPWCRETGDGNWCIGGPNQTCTPIPPGSSMLEFYSAEVTIFSPYGRWQCGAWRGTGICGSPGGLSTYCCMNPIDGAGLEFHLQKDDNAVNFNLTNDSMSVDLSDDSDTITAAATLGDDNSRPKRDRDTFTFHFGPNPGDRLVTVTLEPDPSAGHTGEQATLILQNGNSTVESKTDVLPIEITATLPSDGEYQLVVEQNGIPEDVRFRGNYYLSVKSDSGDVEVIKPSEDVEQ